MPPAAHFTVPEADAGRLPLGQNFGDMRHSLSSSGLVINVADHMPRMVVPAHAHDNAYLCVVLAGDFHLQAGRSHWCQPGSVLAHPQGQCHANRFGASRGRCLSIHFGGLWQDDPALRRFMSDSHHVQLAPHAAVLRRLGREMHAGDSAAPLAAASAAIELLAEAMRLDAPAAQPRWLRRAIDLIEADLSRAPALGELAALVDIHPAHLARVFRQTFHETVGDYVRRRRIEHAEQLLLRGHQSLAEISAVAGFADQAHFSRVFKRHFGVTPSARRRAMQTAS